MQKSESIDKLAQALVAVQGAIKPAIRDGTNPHYRSTYATLNSVWDAARPLLAANGLAIVQSVSPSDPGRVALTTTILHSSGQWMSDTGYYTTAKDDPQGAGSAITYGRRYGMCAALGIVADEDDDGNAASTPPAAQQRQPQAQPTKVPTRPVNRQEPDLPF